MSGSGVTRFPREWSAADLGLSAKDLKAAPVRYSSGLIFLRGATEFMLTLEYVIAGTTPTVGTVNVEIEGFATLGGAVLFDKHVILAVTSTEAAGTYRTTVAWGKGTSAKKGTGTFTAADLDILKAIDAIKIHLNLTTAYDQAGAKTASVYLKAV